MDDVIELNGQQRNSTSQLPQTKGVARDDLGLSPADIPGSPEFLKFLSEKLDLSLS